MQTKTPAAEDLHRRLERELSWREDEISGIVAAAEQAPEDAHHLFRAGLVLLCAHWEGFLKKSVTLYLDHVFAQGLKLDELSPLMIAVAFFNDVKHAATASFPGSELHHVPLARRILQGLDAVCAKPGWSVSTEGNPGTDVLDKILQSIGADRQLGMQAQEWRSYTSFIDESILRDRHHVAHGEGLRLSRMEFLDRAKQLQTLLESLLTTIMETARSECYRAQT